MIGYEVLGLIRVPEGVKITPATYFQLLESAVLLGLDDVLVSKRCKLNFQNDTATSNSAKETQAFLSLFGLEADCLIE